MDALAGYESDEGDNTETSPVSTNLKKSEDVASDLQDRTNGEEKRRNKKPPATHGDDSGHKTTSQKYEKRELDCTVNAEITTKEPANGKLINQQANTKACVPDEEKHKEKEKTRHRSRSRSKSDHRSSKSRSRTPDNKNYKQKGKRSRSREFSPTPRSRSHSRSPSHRSQKHSRHSGDKKSSRSTDSRKTRGDSHRRKRRSRSPSTTRRRTSRSRSRDRTRRRSRSKSHERSSKRSRSRSRNRHGRRSRSRDKSSRYRSKSRERDRYSKRHDSRNTKSDSGDVASGTNNDTLKKNTDLAGETSSKLPLKINISGSGQMTPQLAVQQAMAAVNAKAQQLTGISLPKYYNPAAVNPMKYAEQMQKRKLLWNCNKEKQEPEIIQSTSNNQWEKTTFAQDLDGRMTAKFRKLMGIKAGNAVEDTVVPDEKAVSEDPIRKQEEMFRKLDQQYEVARMSTHTHRGVGLGFTSQAHHLFPK